MISELGPLPLQILIVSRCAVIWYSRLACWSQSADSRISASLIVPFELEYMN
jgi:hypothetical protein